ncbi:MAG: rhomboid family intramembrane serine protease [Lachnospiraceae bacterium]|nr:rhomboid family intramembrane serine protease [Lachnospiraceae bacterium]
MVALVVVNVAVWLYLEMGGYTEDASYMYLHGAMCPGALEDGGERWRVVTAMFLHFGIEHLINNMLLLTVLAYRLEPVVGHIGLAIIYFVSGIVGNIVSYIAMMSSGDYSISAGASGAVFGVMGALIPVLLIFRGKMKNLNLKGVLIMIGLSLYYGFTVTGVDNICHITGLLTGILLGTIIGKVIDFIRKNQYT